MRSRYLNRVGIPGSWSHERRHTRVDVEQTSHANKFRRRAMNVVTVRHGGHAESSQNEPCIHISRIPAQPVMQDHL